MSLLIKFCGTSVKDTVKLLMSRLFTNKVMSLMSLQGRNLGKLAFRDTNLCFIVIECALHHHPDSDMSAIRSAIARYLKMAPYRHGGAGKGARLLPPVSDRESDAGHDDESYGNHDDESDGGHDCEPDSDSDGGCDSASV